MKRVARPKPFSKMTTPELDAMAGEFDREFIADTFGPPQPEVRARLRRAKLKRGRPRVGAGSRAISVTVERTLLTRVDRLCQRRGTTRAQLIALGLREILAREDAPARVRAS